MQMVLQLPQQELEQELEQLEQLVVVKVARLHSLVPLRFSLPCPSHVQGLQLLPRHNHLPRRLQTHPWRPPRR